MSIGRKHLHAIQSAVAYEHTAIEFAKRNLALRGTIRRLSILCIIALYVAGAAIILRNLGR